MNAVSRQAISTRSASAFSWISAWKVSPSERRPRNRTTDRHGSITPNDPECKPAGIHMVPTPRPELRGTVVLLYSGKCRVFLGPRGLTHAGRAGPDYGLSPVGDLQLGQNVGDVVTHGLVC
jgi:hypothetical protein